jgi:GAF domain-containing protein
VQEVGREEANASTQRSEHRRQSSLAKAQSLQQCSALPDLLRETLESVCELSGCDRGFLLLGEDGELRVAATRGVASHNLARREFSGSVGAVQRAMSRRAPVVINETRSDPGLAARPSVLQGGLRCLLCLPLLDGDTLIGTIYADSREPGEALSDFDLELLGAFCERASLWIAARREVEALSGLGSLQRWNDLLAAHAETGA